MATCKDCLHHDACGTFRESLMGGLVEKTCKHFKDKEDFASVVRCKNCVYRIKEVIRKVDNLVYWPCRKHGIEVLLTDYCSSGNNTVIGKDLER